MSMVPTLANTDRAQRYMDESGVDALITWSPANVRYLTGYSCWLAPLLRRFMIVPGGGGDLALRAIAVMPRDGEALLVVESLWGLNAVDAWVTDVRLAGRGDVRPAAEPVVVAEELVPLYRQLQQRCRPDTVLDALADALRERALADSRLGVELDGASASELALLHAQLPRAELRDCSSLLRLVRAVKTAGEITRLERAAEISEAAAIAVLAGLEAGATAAELADQYRRLVAADGADLDHFAVAPRGLGFALGGSLAFAPGDAFYVDFGVVHGGWFSDSGTTACIGEPTVPMLTEHGAVRDSVAAGAATLRPGAPAAATATAMRESLAGRGFIESLPHGHGIGIEVPDLPLVMPENGARIADGCVDVPANLPFEENMVVNLEAPLLTPGVRSVHCECTFVLTANGARALIAQNREAPIVSAGIAADRSDRFGR
jgi:Xaa-Pro aminopeptidase